MTDQWVLLWSQSQCAFHIEPASAMITTNFLAFNRDGRMDYIPLWIGERDDCDQAAQRLRPELHRRQEARSAAVMA